MLKCILPLFISCSLYADFTWDGQDYHDNSLSQQQAAHKLLEEIHLSGNESILDVGCGDGKITLGLLDSVPNGCVVGVDLSASQIAYAKRLETKNLSFEVCDVIDLTYNQDFDIVTSFTALQWVPDQPKALKAMQSALKEKGKLLITMPLGITWQLSEAVREVISKDEWKGYPFHDKQYFFSREAYASFLRDAGFTIDSFKIECSYNVFPDRASFTAFVKQWLPFVQDVPNELRDEFMRQVTDIYLQLIPKRESGEVFFDKYVYNIIATRLN